ncbi:GDSL-type esterase/lipase family protein [Dyadobacter psychrotolerans]|uniref:Sialate O-acetylesterase n=1 Tax=Dyadobacter psychrotolerans TaxID=2541721 RepID=A0A4V2Z3Z5_9BACT|nr:GDSL-type esterase/lipase family protein [Dyadobacter psychrotolerans]TDE14688.1 sialate O-acetylesterase [Dyadobacter psychrotolerans]
MMRIPVLLVLMCCCGLASAEQKPIRVACIGNSVTFGYGLKTPSNESYPVVLQNLLGENYQVKNFGHNGATLLKKGHNPYFKTAVFKKALDFKADVIVVHLGLNDTDPRDWPDFKNDFESDYAWLLDTLKQENPSAKIFVCKLTPIFSGHPRFKSGTREWHRQIQQLIPGIAMANGAELIDLHTKVKCRPDLFNDSIHPDKEGAGIIAETIYQHLTGNFGGLKLPPVFSDDMVLQRQKPIVIWGMANCSEQVTVHLANQSLVTRADRNGKWKVVFPAKTMGRPFGISVETKSKSVVFENILIGDVWLCSGQSNMDFKLKDSKTGPAELSENTFSSQIRLFKLNSLAETNNAAWDSATLIKTNKLDFFSGNWKVNDSETAADFSAVAYYFGKKIHTDIDVPIGLIQLAVGGSTTESWIDRNTLEGDDLLVDMLRNWQKSDFIMPWCRERAGTNLKKSWLPKQRHPYEPAYNFEAGISHLTELPLKGVIWYQGESNTHNFILHEHLFKTLIKSWRQFWGFELPFYYVQLSAIDRASWPDFRNSQRQMLADIPYSGMVVSHDLGDSLNVHPVRKKEIGERLALLALRDTYKRKILATGPALKKIQKKENLIYIDFQSQNKLLTSQNSKLTGFELVDEKGKRLPADARIFKNQVIIRVPDGQTIKAVLYAYQPFTRANLINEAGLPASTFSVSIP